MRTVKEAGLPTSMKDSQPSTFPGQHPKKNSNKMGNDSDERSVGTEMAADVVYTRATLDQPNLSEGIGGNEAIGGKLTLGSKTHTRTRNNDATLVLQVAEDQSGWDRPRDVERNLRASGESHDKPTNPTLGPNQSLRGGQQDALSITGQPKQPINEAHEATSPMKLKTKASPLDNTAHLAQDPRLIVHKTEK